MRLPITLLSRPDLPPLSPGRRAMVAIGFASLAAVILLLTAARTGVLPWAGGWMRTAALADRQLTQRGADWEPYEVALRKYYDGWCDRVDTPDCADGGWTDAGFLAEFDAVRDSYLGSLAKSDLTGADLRGADLFRAFLAGTEMRAARLDGATLSEAALEAVILTGAGLNGTDFSGARLDRATLRAERAAGTVFRGASMVAASLTFDALEGADFRGATLRRAVLRGSLQGDFSSDAATGITLFTRADLAGVEIRDSLIGGTLNEDAFRLTNLLGLTEDADGSVWSGGARPARLPGTALQFVDLSATYVPLDETNEVARDDAARLWDEVLKNSFGDASVVLPDYVRRPCQWLDTRTEGLEVFYGTWRAWLEKGGRAWPPAGVMANTKIGVTGDDGTLSTVSLAEIPPLPDRVAECAWREGPAR